MQGYQPKKRRKREIMYEGDVDAAECVTFETETYTTRTGKQKTRKIKVPLSLPGTEPRNEATPGAGPPQNSDHYVPHDVEMTDNATNTHPKPKKVRILRHRIPINIINTPANRPRGITSYSLWTALTICWKPY